MHVYGCTPRSTISIMRHQVLKLESVGGAGKETNASGAEGGKGGAAPGGSNLSMNQTLEGHEGSVVRGNAVGRKR